MFTDITGKKRLKVGLHTHTSQSDGQKTPEEVIRLYEKAGYDILAITDHWIYTDASEYGNMKLISGCEYNIAYYNETTKTEDTFHIVGLNMKYNPKVPGTGACGDMPDIPDIFERVKSIVKLIREAGGIAVLAHPAWSLNSPEQIIAAGDFDALEIYNSVSECGMSDRPYSGIIVDMLATKDVHYPLLATDDAHYYTGDECRGMVMVEADAVEEYGFSNTIRRGLFYATQGPEIHLELISKTKIKLRCTPAVKIVFFSNLVWASEHAIRGEDLTEAVYTIKPNEKFIRAEITDINGLTAWSNIIWLGK